MKKQTTTTKTKYQIVHSGIIVEDTTCDRPGIIIIR
jgi:hypothetical protein